ncbi:hypothetical protein BN406_03821 (plasmid) [Sinorhizobium meliloti Rm41]|nr:hypothetical protein BN406_03821 [Sinorhizobium meliloti Rm41]
MTPIRVLDGSLRDKGLGKGVKKGRIWTYVRDQRPWAGAAPPGAVYYFAPDWKEEHVHHHLRQTSGVLQADGYKGYGKLYESGADGIGRFREAACWAHGDVTSMISGPRTNPRSRERLSIVSVRFTTSSATLQASPSMSALLLVRSTAKQRSKHSASGLKRNWPVFRARAIWLKLSDMA